MKISIIIPTYNEEKNIQKTLKGILEDFKTAYKYEVVVVCDGCTDQTYTKAFNIAKKSDGVIKVLSYKTNKGKGYALSYGVKRASGNIISFYDAGGDFDINHVDRFVKLQEVFNADIVLGSKRHPASNVIYPLVRRIYSKIYQIMIRLLFNLKITDTQAGIKVFKKEVIEKILPRARVKKYAFDLEVLVIAKKLGYKRIFEAPVNLNYNFSNTGIKAQSIWQIILDTFAIFYRLHITKYYNKEHARMK